MAEIIALTLLLGIDLGMLVYHIGLNWRRRKIEADLAEQAEAFRRRTWQPTEWINVGEMKNHRLQPVVKVAKATRRIQGDHSRNE